MSGADGLLGEVRFWGGGAAVVLGLCLMLIGQLGQLRLRDVYMRIHSAGLGDGLGAGLVLIGLAIAAPSAALAVRLLVLALLTWTLAPVLGHLGVNAAHGGGVAPAREHGASRRRP